MWAALGENRVAPVRMEWEPEVTAKYGWDQEQHASLHNFGAESLTKKRRSL